MRRGPAEPVPSSCLGSFHSRLRGGTLPVLPGRALRRPHPSDPPFAGASTGAGFALTPRRPGDQCGLADQRLPGLLRSLSAAPADDTATLSVKATPRVARVADVMTSGRRRT